MRLLLALVLWLLPVAGQASCADEFRLLIEAVEDSGALREMPTRPVRTTADRRCRVDDMPISSGRTALLNVGALIWTPGEIEAAFNEKILPKTMRLEARDIKYRGSFGDRELDRMVEQAWGRQVPPADVALAWDWVEDERLLLLEQVRVRWTGDEAITVSGVIENVDLRSSGAAQMSVTAWGARTLVIRANVDHFLGKGIAHLLRDVRGDDVARVLRDVPPELLDASSKAALRHILDDRNNLKGSIEIRTTAEPGLGPARFLPLVTGAIGFGDTRASWALFDGVAVDISYVPR